MLFNDGSVEVGNFTIGFDPARVDGVPGASGFFVASTVGIAAILFDVAPTGLSASGDDLHISADLLVSPEFGAFLFDAGLSAINLAGADVGDALVEGELGCTGSDFDDDGDSDGRDLRAFVRDWLQGGDFNGDGVSRTNDLRQYLRTWFNCVFTQRNDGFGSRRWSRR